MQPRELRRQVLEPVEASWALGVPVRPVLPQRGLPVVVQHRRGYPLYARVPQRLFPQLYLDQCHAPVPNVVPEARCAAAPLRQHEEYVRLRLWLPLPHCPRLHVSVQ